MQANIIQYLSFMVDIGPISDTNKILEQYLALVWLMHLWLRLPFEALQKHHSHATQGPGPRWCDGKNKY